MADLVDFFSNLLSTDKWPPRWFCGEWTEFHGWLYIISDLLIWAAYFAIPLSIYYFMIKRKHDLPYVKVFWLFIFFILLCGLTHLIDAVIFWYPMYRLSAFILFLTALVSVATVIGLVRIMPEALKLKSPKELERIIQERTKELTLVNAHLNVVNRDLDNFIYASSHDLKSPVNNVEGLVNILQQHLDDKDEFAKEIINKIEVSIAKANDSIKKINSISRVQRSPYEDIAELEIEKTIDEVLSENEILVKKHAAKITKNLLVGKITYSNRALKSILYNLISNAIKYRSAENDPVIEIGTFQENDTDTILYVKDNGMGIDLNKHGKKLFRLFTRIHQTEHGSGVGLYAVKNQIENLRGTINVESSPGKGSTFIIKITKLPLDTFDNFSSEET